MTKEITKTAPAMPEEQAAEIISAQSVEGVQAQDGQLRHLLHDVLKRGEDYDVIPGCGQKPTLLQPGAQKIACMFGLVPTYSIARRDYDRGHREYEITCTLTGRATGEIVGTGVGACSTLESKYRYRRRNGSRVENPDIADTYNTVLKMAQKRAFVDAVLYTTAASALLTQDLEDMRSEQTAPAAIRPVDDTLAHAYKRMGEAIEKWGAGEGMSRAEIEAEKDRVRNRPEFGERKRDALYISQVARDYERRCA